MGLCEVSKIVPNLGNYFRIDAVRDDDKFGPAPMKLCEL
jgi:hypothetical protein